MCGERDVNKSDGTEYKQLIDMDNMGCVYLSYNISVGLKLFQ